VICKSCVIPAVAFGEYFWIILDSDGPPVSGCRWNGTVPAGLQSSTDHVLQDASVHRASMSIVNAKLLGTRPLLLARQAARLRQCSQHSDSRVHVRVRKSTLWQMNPWRFCYPWGTMSAINGDKARFNRERKGKLARRERNQALRKKLKGHTPPRATGAQL
jgi:hypothetical protein